MDNGENIFLQNDSLKGVKRVVDKRYVLLENQSTIDQICNAALLKNIRKTTNPIVVYCNAGSMSPDMEGDLGLMTMRHNPRGIANVLSLRSIKQKYRVTYDIWNGKDGVFVVHTEHGPVVFMPNAKGLHYHDTS